MICRWLAMYIRCVVAVMDFNANVSRPVKQVEGNIQYKMKVHIKLILKRGSPAVEQVAPILFKMLPGIQWP